MPTVSFRPFSVRRRLSGILAGVALSASFAVAQPVHAETVVRAVMQSDVKILDPIWTTAYITRNFGYMIYDTLFAQDAKSEIQPQMAEGYEVSPDKLTYTIKLRDGLLWHDGAPVTAEDCVASIKRWAARDALGQKMLGIVDSVSASDPKTIVIKLKEPSGLLIFALGKPSSNTPFMMPAARRRDGPEHADFGFRRLGPLRLQEG